VADGKGRVRREYLATGPNQVWLAGIGRLTPVAGE